MNQNIFVAEIGALFWVVSPAESTVICAWAIHEQEKHKMIQWIAGWEFFPKWCRKLLSLWKVLPKRASDERWWLSALVVQKPSGATDEFIAEEGNSNTNCKDFIHDVCIKCSRYIYLFFRLPWSSSDTWTANSECCPFRHLAMNLSIERITEGFTNESHLGSMSSHDLISRDSSG